MSIVVGTDFSKYARDAVEAAVGIARKSKDKVHLVHVAWETDPAKEDRSPGADLAQGRLAREAARFRGEGAAVEEVLLRGNADEAIVAYAREVRARLLVIAAIGYRTDSRTGSIADRIAQNSPCPVLVVRALVPFLEWTRGERPLRVVVGDDLSTTSDAALRWLRVLGSIGPIQASVAHVYSPFGEYGRLGFSADRQREIESVLQRDLKERLERLPVVDATSGIRMAPSQGRPADALVAMAIEEKADLLVLGSHGRGRLGRAWHGSVSHTAAQLAPMSFAVVPATTVAEASPPSIPPMRRVLVSTDFSPAGNAAIGYGCSILGKGGQLFVAHVVDSIPVVYATKWEVRRALPPGGDDEAALRQRLEGSIPRDASARGIEARVEVLYGFDVALAICQAAERDGVDAICIGSHGRVAAVRLVLGSVVQQVMARTRRPVLVVRPPVP